MATYAITCLYGLERALAGEVSRRLGVEVERHWCEVVFDWEGDAARLAELRTAQNVFSLFEAFQVSGSRDSLATIAERVRRIAIPDWQETFAAVEGSPPDSGEVSVGVQRKGEHSFTYKDVEEAALDAFSEAGVRAVLDARPLELQIDIHRNECRLLGRLASRPLSVRAYKRYHGSGETEPTLAAALVDYAAPVAGEPLLDPFCGTGTILIERNFMAPPGPALGGDVSAKKLGWAGADAEIAGVELDLYRGDAAALPFRERTFGSIATSPPQSDPVTGRPWKPADFARLMRECLRVLDYDGTLAMLLRDPKLGENAVKGMPNVRVRRRVMCNWKGRACSILVVSKSLGH